MLELPHRLHKWMIVSVIMPYSISLRFNHYLISPRPLQVVMDEISQKAQERGLTPEILESLLNGE